MTKPNDISEPGGDTSNVANSRPLEVLENEFAATLKSDLPNVIKRGQLLIEIKAALGHGKWRPWLAGKFALSESTAQNYMNAARFAEKYPTVRNLNFGPGVLYWLVARDDRLTLDQLNAVFDLAKDRWIGLEDVLKVAGRGRPQPSPEPALGPRHKGGQVREPDDPQMSIGNGQVTKAAMLGPSAIEDAPPIVPEQGPAEPVISAADIPQAEVLQLGGFDATIRLMLKYAAMPVAKLVTATNAPATSAGDIEMVGNFLKTLADAIKKRRLDPVA